MWHLETETLKCQQTAWLITERGKHEWPHVFR